MRIILTAKEVITAKDGTQYVKCSYISASDGKTGDVFLPKDKYDAFAVVETSFLSSDMLKELVREAPISEVDFDQRGRVVGLV